MAEPSLDRSYRSYNQFSDEPLALVPPLKTGALESSGTELVAKAARALQIGYVLLVMLAGVDKFANVLTDWTQYLGSTAPRLLAITPQSFLYLVGVWEIFLALGLALRPRVFGDVLAAWLGVIIFNLLAQHQYLDIALRDFVLAAGACALSRLGHFRERSLSS